MLLINGKPLARHLREQTANGVLDPNAKDRFGLPCRPAENEDEAARRKRLNQVRDLIFDATAAVARQVGEDEARLLFKLVFQTPRKGRRADDKENTARLRAYDAALARGFPRKQAALVAAKEMTVSDEDPEGIAKQIRRLVKSRNMDLLWLNAVQAACGLSDGLIGPSHPNSDL